MNLFGLAAALTAGLLAQDGRADLLDTVTELRCEFSRVAVASWDARGGASSELRPSTLVISFIAIDVDSGSAEVATARGRVLIVAQRRGDYLHLLQVDASGFLHATTVFARSDANGRFRSVHSRHEYTDVALPGFTSRPEQHVGSCGPPSR